MMKKLQPVRGTKDLLPELYACMEHIIQTAQMVSHTYGFVPMEVPIFEFTEVFKRTLGDVSDIVTKEMYSFTDRSDEALTLRPEFTASIMRSVISNGLTQTLPLKFFTSGPLFRYERPQRGRYRQFHQVNLELIGVASVQADLEMISLAQLFLNSLGLEKDITLELNSLGDTNSRTAYREALTTYLNDHVHNLSEESKQRLTKNPLRILDSKDADDKVIVANAPTLAEYYTSEAHTFFIQLQEGLKAMDITYTINPKLVRGLDYYCHTAFEFTTTKLGAQNAVLGGGRYDGLCEMMGGPALPAIGFAAGIERLAELIAETYTPKASHPVAVLPVGDTLETPAQVIAYRLRKAGFYVEYIHQGSLGKRLKKADKLGAKKAILLGEEEYQQQSATLRDLSLGEEKRVALSELETLL